MNNEPTAGRNKLQQDFVPQFKSAESEQSNTATEAQRLSHAIVRGPTRQAQFTQPSSQNRDSDPSNLLHDTDESRPSDQNERSTLQVQETLESQQEERKSPTIEQYFETGKFDMKLNQMHLKQINVESLDQSFTDSPNRQCTNQGAEETRPAQNFSTFVDLNQAGGSSSEESSQQQVARPSHSSEPQVRTIREEPPIHDPYTDTKQVENGGPVLTKRQRRLRQMEQEHHLYQTEETRNLSDMKAKEGGGLGSIDCPEMNYQSPDGFTNLKMNFLNSESNHKSPEPNHLEVSSSIDKSPKRLATQQLSLRKSRKSGILHQSVSSLTYERDLTSESIKRHEQEKMMGVHDVSGSFDTRGNPKGKGILTLQRLEFDAAKTSNNGTPSSTGFSQRRLQVDSNRSSRTPASSVRGGKFSKFYRKQSGRLNSSHHTSSPSRGSRGGHHFKKAFTSLSPRQKKKKEEVLVEQVRMSGGTSFSQEDLKNIETIRKITKDNHKELGEFLNERRGTIPIFGYPLICYNPTGVEPKAKPRERILYDPKLHSLWLILSRSIYSSVKEGNQLLIKDLLDSHDLLNDHFEELLKKFAKGKPLNEEIFKHLRKSKRSLKQRPVARQEKKKRSKIYKPMEFKTSYNHILGHHQKHHTISKSRRKGLIPFRQATVMPGSKHSSEDSHPFDSASMTSEDFSKSGTPNRFQKGSTINPKSGGDNVKRAGKKVVFGTPALDEIVENKDSVSSSSREDSEMPRINIQGPNLYQGSDNTSSFLRKSAVRAMDIQRQIQEHLNDGLSLEPPSDNLDQSPSDRFFLTKGTIVENDFTNLSQQPSDRLSILQSERQLAVVAAKKKAMARRRSSKMSGKKKRYIFKNLYPSNFAMNKAKPLRDHTSTTSGSKSESGDQVNQTTQSDKGLGSSKPKPRMKQSSQSVKRKQKFKVGLIHKGASKKKNKDVVSDEIDLGGSVHPKSGPSTKRIQMSPNLTEEEPKKNSDIILVKDTTETEAEEREIRQQILTKAVIEERMAQLTREMREKVFSAAALKQLDKRSSPSAVLSSKIEAKMKKFQEKAAQLQIQQRRQNLGSPQGRSSLEAKERGPVTQLGSNMTASPTGGTAPHTLNVSLSHQEGPSDPPILKFKFGPPGHLSSKKEVNSAQVGRREKNAPIKIDVQVRKSTSSLYYGLAEDENDPLAPLFLNKIQEQSQAEEDYLNSDKGQSNHFQKKLYSQRTSSTNIGSILKQKKGETDERTLPNSLLDTDGGEGAHIYSDLLASPVAANGESSHSLNQRTALFKTNLNRIKLATEKQIPRRFLKVMFNQNQLQESSLVNASRGGHATMSENRNESTKILFSKTTDQAGGLKSMLPKADRTMGDHLNHDLEGHFHPNDRPKKLTDFRSSRPQTQVSGKRKSMSPHSPALLDRTDFNIEKSITLFSKKGDSAFAPQNFKFSPKSSGLSSKCLGQNEKLERANLQLSQNKFYPYAREGSMTNLSSKHLAKRSGKHSQQEDQASMERLNSNLLVESNEGAPLQLSQEDLEETTNILAFSAFVPSSKHGKPVKQNLVEKSRAGTELVLGLTTVQANSKVAEAPELGNEKRHENETAIASNGEPAPYRPEKQELVKADTSLSSITREYQAKAKGLKRILHSGRKSMGVLPRSKGNGMELASSNQVSLGTPLEQTRPHTRSIHKNFKSQVFGKWMANKATSPTSASGGNQNYQSHQSLLEHKRLLHAKAMANIRFIKNDESRKNFSSVMSKENLYGDWQSQPDSQEYFGSEVNESACKRPLAIGEEGTAFMRARTTEIHQIYSSGGKYLRKTPFGKEKGQRMQPMARQKLMEIREPSGGDIVIAGGSESKPAKVLNMPLGSPSNLPLEKRKSQKFLLNRLNQKKQERRLVYLKDQSRLLSQQSHPLSVMKQQSGSQQGMDSLRQGMKPRLSSVSDLRRLEGYNMKMSQLAEPVLSSKRE